MIFLLKCSSFSAEHSHIIKSASLFFFLSEKRNFVDHVVQKPQFFRKPTSEHFRQKCPLDKRKSMV
jgi:hypothetical protein